MSKFTGQIAEEVRLLVQNEMRRAKYGAYGEVYYVIEDSDPNYQQLNERYPGKVYTTLEGAYAAVTSNNNDLILMSGYTTHSLTTGIAWSKSRVKVVGMDGGEERLVQQGTKVELTGAVDSVYILKNTGTRNTFENIKFIQSSTHANALNVVQFAGEGNFYKNCSFMFGVTNNLGSTSAAEALVGEDSGTFLRCSFGNDNLLSTAARNVFAFDAISGSASGGAGAKNNRFIDCEWIIVSSSASAILVKVVDTGAVEFLNVFIRPQFHAILHAGAGGVAITNAVQSVASLTGGSIDFYLPASFNCTNFCATLTAQIKVWAPISDVIGGEAITPT